MYFNDNDVFTTNVRPIGYRHFQIHFEARENDTGKITICGAHQDNRIKLPTVMMNELHAFFHGFSSAIICVDYLAQNEIIASSVRNNRTDTYIDTKYTLLLNGDTEITNNDRKCVSFSSDR